MYVCGRRECYYSHQTHQYLASVRKADNPFLVCVCVCVVCVCVCVCVWLTATKASRKTRGELSKNVDADYYGYRDEDDGVIVPLEQEQENKGGVWGGG